MSDATGKIVVPFDIKPYPEPHEIEVARILSEHYNCAVNFLKPIDCYKVKTADIVMMGNIWEIKSPTGNSRKNTIKGQFSKAKGKKHHLIIDGRRTKLPDEFVIDRITFELTVHKSVKKLLYVTKEKIVLEIK
jgi:hypothetical protein